MQCYSPRTVGFKSDGKTLAWSQKEYSKEFSTIQIPCGKCLACRLENSRQTAIRCVHESQQYQNNCFLTLTYSEEKLESEKLNYRHIQLFIKKLRSKILDQKLEEIYGKAHTVAYRRLLFKTANKETRQRVIDEIRISSFITGEYGDKNKRPHWHLLIFNWYPKDAKYYRTTDRGDKVFTSDGLDDLWTYNDKQKRPNEIGELNFSSASYCARYASKKLYHGKDGTHEFNPISRRSSKNAIGKSWIQKHWKYVFDKGYVTFKRPDGQILQSSIPRYYEKWLKKEQPEQWEKYVTGLKQKNINKAIEKDSKITNDEKLENFKRAAKDGLRMIPGLTKKETKKIIMEKHHNEQKQHLKL